MYFIGSQSTCFKDLLNDATVRVKLTDIGKDEFETLTSLLQTNLLQNTDSSRTLGIVQFIGVPTIVRPRCCLYSESGL